MPADRLEQRVTVEQLEIAGELLHPVDVAAALDLDGDRLAVRVATHQVDRADGGRVLATYQGEAGRERGRVIGEQLLEVLLDAVLLEPGSMPRSCSESWWISSSTIRRVSSGPLAVLRLVTFHSRWPSSFTASLTVQGGDIQLSGL